jgi:ribosomal protein S27E
MFYGIVAIRAVAVYAYSFRLACGGCGMNLLPPNRHRSISYHRLAGSNRLVYCRATVRARSPQCAPVLPFPLKPPASSIDPAGWDYAYLNVNRMNRGSQTMVCLTSSIIIAGNISIYDRSTCLVCLNELTVFKNPITDSPYYRESTLRNFLTLCIKNIIS